jgi:type IV pilus assembly protein PilQ
MLFSTNEPNLMKTMFKKWLYLCCILVLTANINGFAQNNNIKLQEELTRLAGNEIPQLNEKVNISVTNTSIQDFLRGVASNTGVNINVDPSIQLIVANNFTDVKVIDVLLFISQQYNLSISVIGNIINVNKEVVVPVMETRKPTVVFDAGSGNLTIECENEDLINVAKDIATATGRNLIPAPGLDRLKVNGYIRNMPIENALDKFAFTNNVAIRKTDDGVFLVEKITQPDNYSSSSKQQNNRSSNKRTSNNSGNSGIQILKLGPDSFNVSAEEAPIYDIIKQAADELNKDYYFTSPLQGNSTLTLKNIGFDQLLNSLFKGTTYSFQKAAGVFIIGDSKNGELKEYRMVQLQNRNVDKLSEIIPKEITRDLEVKEFSDLNTIYIAGIHEKVNIAEGFIKSLDKVIPVILIEVMIIEVKKSNSVEAGIKAGLGNKPVTTQGAVFPDVDMDLGAQSINTLIDKFNGFGTVKIGKVTPNFYVNLKALEENGMIDIQSTPKLSTLNGHEATLSIGNTQYYREQQSNYYGSISSQMATNEVFKPVTAELLVKIKPNVSGDDQITLEIEVIQGDFTDRISEYAPPGQVKREFKSLIRVKNQEMVLLGGLEENKKNDAGTGTPFLSRIPGIKWLFSSRSRSDSKSKLNIFIKPTIID